MTDALEAYRERLRLRVETGGNERCYTDEFTPPTFVLEGFARAELLERGVVALEQGAAAPKRKPKAG